MAFAAPAATPGRAEPGRFLRGHPECGALLIAGLAWVALLALHRSGAAVTGAGAELAAWAVMVVAMMVPPSWPAVRHVALNTLRRRRRHAIAEFLAAYVAVWVAFGAAALGGLALAERALPAHAVLVAVLVVAAGWQLVPWQRRFQRACHATVALPPRGMRATVGCVRFGWRQGRACVGLCWPLMLVMAAVGHHALLWMVVLTGLVALRKLRPAEVRLARPVAAALAGVAAVVALAGPVGPAHAEHGSHHGGGAPVVAVDREQGANGVLQWFCRGLVGTPSR